MITTVRDIFIDGARPYTAHPAYCFLLVHRLPGVASFLMDPFASAEVVAEAEDWHMDD